MTESKECFDLGLKDADTCADWVAGVVWERLGCLVVYDFESSKERTLKTK